MRKKSLNATLVGSPGQCESSERESTTSREEPAKSGYLALQQREGPYDGIGGKGSRTLQRPIDHRKKLEKGKLMRKQGGNLEKRSGREKVGKPLLPDQPGSGKKVNNWALLGKPRTKHAFTRNSLSKRKKNLIATLPEEGFQNYCEGKGGPLVPASNPEKG